VSSKIIDVVPLGPEPLSNMRGNGLPVCQVYVVIRLVEVGGKLRVQLVQHFKHIPPATLRSVPLRFRAKR